MLDLKAKQALARLAFTLTCLDFLRAHLNLAHNSCLALQISHCSICSSRIWESYLCLHR